MGETEFVIEPGRQDIVMRRVFDAPPEVVFRAYTDPQLIPQWWGPARHQTTVDLAEVRPGGRWRYVSRDPDGTEYPFRGVYHDIAPSDRIVATFEFEGAPGHVSLDTATFEQVEGGTRLVAVSVFQSVEDRDAMVRSGMQDGAAETMDRLAALVKDLG